MGRYVRSGEPLHFVLPAFPAKSRNPEKVVGSLPDLGIRRVEFLPVMLAIYAIPSLLSVDDLSTLASVHFALAIVMALSIMHFIDMTNAYADRDVDAVYKTWLSQAVYGLGLRNVRWQIAATGAGVLALAPYFTFRTGHWDILPLVAFTLWIGAQYSIPPWCRLQVAELITLGDDPTRWPTADECLLPGGALTATG
ncbi:L-tyrosine/L-tryptophan isonitrile synthase family protein [Micromonospora sp. NPDC047812]|uniref:L-tyrosine/L-tryptophan isonitrile synthase family protein n=1 Tax=Micromonospora sp. NPDC047812 TaxID=3155742 RepID=UPI0034548800